MPEGERAPILETRGLSKRFGGVVAVDAVDLTLSHGEILGVIGPNGAGKSTLVGLLSGAHRASAGAIFVEGVEVTRWPPDARARLGVARTYQVPQPFGRLTVRENVLVACQHARGQDGARRADSEARAEEIIERTGLAEFRDALARDLTLLRLKRLEVARALALEPKLLLLDEVGAGLVPKELDALIELVSELSRHVPGILIVEHVMDVITALCQRVAVLDSGRKIVEGPPRAVLDHPEVLAAYLGRRQAAGEDSAARAAKEPAASPAPRRQPLLELEDVAAGYGAFQALQSVSLQVGEGEIVALLGANGAGKTTTARVVSGLLTPWSGSVRLAGLDVTKLAPHEVVRAGVAHCLEGRRIFASLTVEENLRLAVRGAHPVKVVEARLERVYALFPALRDKRRQSGGALSGGEQQMLAIGRALMGEPRLIVFDEISLGLAPIVVDRLYEALREIHRAGVAMIVIEQNVERGLALAERAYVLEKGSVVLAGDSASVRADPRLAGLYGMG